MKIELLLTVFLIFAISDGESYKILAVFPIPSISHQVVFRKITQELARRGHEITVITPDPIYRNGDAPSNFIEIDVHDISYSLWAKAVTHSLNITGEPMTFEDIREGCKFFVSLFHYNLKQKQSKKLFQRMKNLI